MQEIAIRVRLEDQEQLGLAEYERVVASVATLASLAAWLPTPENRLVLRGRGAEPVRLETVSYGTSFEMLVVLDQTSPAVERAAGVLAATIGAVGSSDVQDAAAGVAGEIDRLDRAAPRGRSTAERSLRAFLEGARADVLGRRSTTRVRAATALVRLAEGGARVSVERIADALVPEVEETVVSDALPEVGDRAVIGAAAPAASVSADEKAEKKADKKAEKKKADGKKSDGKKSDGKKSDKGGGKKSDKKKTGGKK